MADAQVIQPTYIQHSMKPQKRRYVCEVCGIARVIEVRMIEKWVVVCSHQDSRGGTLPVMQLREEGQVVQ